MRATLPSMASLVRQALREDVGSGDVTTRCVVPSGRLGLGTIRAKEPLLLAGLPLAREVFRQVDPTLRFEPLRAEGSRVGRGTPVARIRGRAASILTGERTALNFLQHLSGIATYTAKCVAEARGRCSVRDTRKTHPGLREIEKYAVRLAGGRNHRFGLNDGILIKHNHWRIAGGVKACVERARRSKHRKPSFPVQVEVSTLPDLQEALEAGADSVLLDNLSPQQVRRALKLIRGRIPVELSGGITQGGLGRFAAVRPDCISLGALTHSSRWVDLSLRLEGAGK
ncbi:MAG: carboxylating nicotinate-nucleotide diphosphorylase [Acidobacteria bacterium]|nr:carboxylating nicotinate-nucleotide diphosphorylase [Acidobacteriota bacterium]MCI0567733.1 carboxylating nicotinate-nucleotide diphosphorylase [Acidobacteriota bacterium]